MFTGLVSDRGELLEVRPHLNGRILRIRCGYDLSQVSVGDSIAVNGVCLTAETLGPDTFTATAGAETLARTTLGQLRRGDRVHLELALRVGDRLGGHMVQGHVDGVGKVRSCAQQGESHVVQIEAPAALTRYIVEKGSICVDGVSLTVNEIQGSTFRVNIIPHTAANTGLAALRPGQGVNLEVDIIARYVERMLGDRAGGLTLDTLRAHGYE